MGKFFNNRTCNFVVTVLAMPFPRRLSKLGKGILTVMCLVPVAVLHWTLFDNSKVNMNPDNTGGPLIRMTQVGISNRVESDILIHEDKNEKQQRKFDLEYEGMRHRLPNCIIIGPSLCGEGTLEFFLVANPNIRTDGKEVNFFATDRLYKLGYDWFRKQLPATKQDQITIQRGTTYFDTAGVPERIKHMNESVKLILIVCNPIFRTLAYYSRMVSSAKGKIPLFNETLFKANRSGSMMVNTGNRAISSGYFAYHLSKWWQHFPKEQILIVDGDRLYTDPLPIMGKVESFLGLNHLITAGQVFYNASNQAYCKLRQKEQLCLLRNQKSQEILRTIPKEFLDKLDNHFRPLNSQFFSMINERMDWSMPMPAKAPNTAESVPIQPPQKSGFWPL